MADHQIDLAERARSSWDDSGRGGEDGAAIHDCEFAKRSQSGDGGVKLRNEANPDRRGVELRNEANLDRPTHLKLRNEPNFVGFSRWDDGSSSAEADDSGGEVDRLAGAWAE